MLARSESRTQEKGILVGAGLLLRAWQKTLAVDPGFRAENVFTFNIKLPSSTYENASDSGVDQSFARRYWPGTNPIGKRIRMKAQFFGPTSRLGPLRVAQYRSGCGDLRPEDHDRAAVMGAGAPWHASGPPAGTVPVRARIPRSEQGAPRQGSMQGRHGGAAWLRRRARHGRGSTAPSAS